MSTYKYKKCYFGCVTDSVLHRFPNPRIYTNEERFKLWINVLDTEMQGRDSEYIYNNLRLCDEHFEQVYLTPSKKLTRNAVPTLNTTPCKIRKDIQTTSKHPLSARISGLKIALLQLAVGPDKSKNVAHAVKEIHSVKEKGAQLVVLPECFNSPYGTKYFADYAEEVPSGATCRALSKAAAEAGVCVVGGTVPERCGNKLYNTCTVWDSSGKLLAQYRKMHLFDIDIPNKITFRESEVLSAGNEVATFEFQGIKIGLGICYDLRFPELAKLMANEGCSLLIYPGAFNMTTGPKHWELLGRARATDYQLWVALASPARDTAADYVAWGHSTVVDPWGSVVGSLGDEAGALLADIDMNTVEKVRDQIPIRRQRRTDIYDTISKS